MSVQENDWRNHPVDERIVPLVQALNATGVVKTIASCEGHFLRVSDPYVFFSCSPAVAEVLARRLDQHRRQGKLNYYWQLTGVFDTEHKLGFTLRAGALDHGRGLLRTFWLYVICRRRIDQDLAVIEQAWSNLAQDEIELARLEHPVSGHQNNDQHNQRKPLLPPALTGKAASRIGSTAVGTGAFGIRGNGCFADVAGDEAWHSDVSLKSRVESNLPKVVVLKKRPLPVVSVCRQPDGTRGGR